MPKKARKKIGYRKKIYITKMETMSDVEPEAREEDDLEPSAPSPQRPATELSTPSALTEKAVLDDSVRPPRLPSERETTDAPSFVFVKMETVSDGSEPPSPPSEYADSEMPAIGACAVTYRVSPPPPAAGSPTEDELVNKMAEVYASVVRTISPEWHVLHLKTGIQFYQINHGVNCQVKKSVFLDNDGALSIHVHHMPLPRSDDAWTRCRNLPEKLRQNSTDDVAEMVSDVLVKLCANVCPGNNETTYRYLWLDGRYEKTGAVEEKFAPAPTFRVFACELLAPKGKCGKCRSFRHSLQSQHSRQTKLKAAPGEDGGPGISAFRPNSSLSVPGLKQKLVACASKIRQLEGKVAYRDKKIKELLGSEGAGVGGGGDLQLSGSSKDGQGNESEYQKVLVERQKMLSILFQLNKSVDT